MKMQNSQFLIFNLCKNSAFFLLTKMQFYAIIQSEVKEKAYRKRQQKKPVDSAVKNVKSPRSEGLAEKIQVPN